ncbi:hypothetical protein HKD37_01G000131 [Glycine soja]
MHRQSLGSPSPKVPKLITDEDDDAPKPHRLSLSLSSPPPTPPHKFVHLIPLLTLLCFFVLYLFSHSPSPSDLNHFTGFNRSPSHRLGTATARNAFPNSFIFGEEDRRRHWTIHGCKKKRCFGDPKFATASETSPSPETRRFLSSHVLFAYFP